MIEEFQRALAIERAAELKLHIERIAGSPPPLHLVVLRGTLQAHYDDGIDIEASLEFLAVPKRPEPGTWKGAALRIGAGSLLGFAGAFLLTDWLSIHNPVASVKQLAAVAVIACMAFYAGRFWKP